MMPILLALWVANRKVYGAQKLWKAARRAGHDIGRDQVGRLMRQLGIEGVSRQRKKTFTTRADPGAWRAPDLVDRNFTAAAPNRLWVTDLERHEVLTNRAVMEGHRRALVAAGVSKLGAA
jgi:putative transposase